MSFNDYILNVKSQKTLALSMFLESKGELLQKFLESRGELLEKFMESRGEFYQKLLAEFPGIQEIRNITKA